MRTATTFVLVLLLGTTKGAGQERKGPPVSSTPKAPWSKAVEGLQCWLQADRDVWKVDEIPSFRLHVRNQGKRDLEIHMAQDACKLELDGAWFDWMGPVSILGGTWPAGRQYDDFEVRVTLATRWTRDNKPLTLKPGKHKVRVAYVTLDRNKPVRVVSNAIEIQVAEATSSKATDKAVQELKEEIKALRLQLEKIERRLSEIEKAKPK
jgi:hypothetical protein